MKIINWNDIVSSGRDFFQGQKTGITIGTFDGVHAGHKTLIDMCVSYSKLHNLIPLAVTFSFPPKKSLSPLDYPGEILPFACKINLLDKLGIRQVLVIDFSSEFGRMSGEDFVREPVKVLENVQMVWVDRMCFNSPEQEIPEIWHYNTTYDFNMFVRMKDGTFMAAGKGIKKNFKKNFRTLCFLRFSSFLAFFSFLD